MQNLLEFGELCVSCFLFCCSVSLFAAVGFVSRFRGDRPREPPDPPPLTVSLLITAKRVQKPPLVSKNPGFDEEKKFIRSLFEPKWKVIFEIVDIDGQDEDVCKPCDLGHGKEGFEKLGNKRLRPVGSADY